MNRITIIKAFLALLLIQPAAAQPQVEAILQKIAENNTTLKALLLQADADKRGQLTGIYPGNPAVGYNYLWGLPSVIGDRQDFSVVQEFDFPTAYSYRKQIAGLQHRQTDFGYATQLREIRMMAGQLCMEAIGFNIRNARLVERLRNARQLVEGYRLQYSAGEIGQLELNKAELHLLNMEREQRSVVAERETVMAALARLNGGDPVLLPTEQFAETALPADVEEWLSSVVASHPALEWLRTGVEISGKQAELGKALSLPRLQTGYMSEQVAGQSFRGIAAGITLPLWEHKNQVKQAQLQEAAFAGMEADQAMQLVLELRQLHARALALSENLETYAEGVAGVSNHTMLERALAAGEISLLEYLLELGFYYESETHLIELTVELHKTLAVLNQYR